MVAKTLTISLPEDLLSFLHDNLGISASKVFQSALLNIQESIKHNPQLIRAIKDLDLAKKVRDKLQLELQKSTEFITIKGLWEEYEKT